MLGISVDRLRHLVSEKEIAYYKQGNRVYFAKADLESYRLAHRVASNAELREKALLY